MCYTIFNKYSLEIKFSINGEVKKILFMTEKSVEKGVEKRVKTRILAAIVVFQLCL